MYHKYGWKVKLNHEFREKRDQNFRPSFLQSIPLLPFSIRYGIFWLKLWRQKKLPFIDGIRPLQVDQYHGVPIGGIGGGSIGRGFHGEFCRYHIIPGIYHHEIVYANQFIVTLRKKNRVTYQQVLSPYYPNSKTFNSLTSWNWGYCGEFAEYCALYPQSWTTYTLPGQNIVLILQQISPIIPHNYKDSSLPTAIFKWKVINNNDEPVDVSITFTFKNGIGCKREDRKGGCWTESFVKDENNIIAKGVTIHQTFRDTMPCTYNIAAIESNSVTVSYCRDFDPCGSGEKLWNELLHSRNLSCEKGKSKVTEKGEEIACAVSSFCCLQSQKSEEIIMTLAYDMPRINFRGNQRSYLRYYKKYFKEENSGPSICHYALSNYSTWEKSINSWQSKILNNEKLASWYKSALFNELYFISDGGSLWVQMPTDCEKEDLRQEYGRFAYLESHEYRMFNTYDVHFYASFALTMLWPKLQLSMQYDFADTITNEWKENIYYLMDGEMSYRKSINTIPHDLGDPEDEPWLKINGYQIHDVSKWKDLNVKFVLQVYRDYVFTNDEQYLKDMWKYVKVVMYHTLQFDKDNDGVIENDGFADQTFDTWIMKGTSAYCGCLWLSALHSTMKMAKIMGEISVFEEFSSVFEKGKVSFEEKLWTGSYYKFDSSNKSNSLSIMSDQLCGHWYHKACKNNEPFLPQEHILTSLKTIFNYNVMKNKNGQAGAVNGMLPNGKIDKFTLQSEETWTGVTYALAATMIHEGLWKEGMATAEGMYRTIYEELGLGFQTPEAIYQKNHYRAPGYMRALSIWGIQWAIENTQV